MRIGLVTDCYVPQVGGIEMQVHDLARHLMIAGHEVVVITPTAGPPEVDGVRVHRLDVPLLPFSIPFTRRSFRLVADLLREEEVDVAHFHGGIVSPLAFVGAHDSQKRGIPTVVTAHCLWSYATPLFALLDKAVHWSDWNVLFSAVSDVAAAPVRLVAGPDRDVVVIPNGIDNAQWQPTDLHGPHRGTLERGSDAHHGPGNDAHGNDAHGNDVVTIVSVMRLAPRKRPLQLIRMIGTVRRRLPASTPMELVIVGDGPKMRAVRRAVRSEGLEDVVKLVGRRSRDEIREIFSRADIFVAPANLESFGLAALEARCAGLPVVAKARTGVREFVEDGRNGLLARSDHQMVDHIHRLVRDRELRGLIAKRNRETPSPVDWSDVVEKNLSAYRRVITEACADL